MTEENGARKARLEIGVAYDPNQDLPTQLAAPIEADLPSVADPGVPDLPIVSGMNEDMPTTDSGEPDIKTEFGWMFAKNNMKPRPLGHGRATYTIPRDEAAPAAGDEPVGDILGFPAQSADDGNRSTPPRRRRRHESHYGRWALGGVGVLAVAVTFYGGRALTADHAAPQSAADRLTQPQPVKTTSAAPVKQTTRHNHNAKHQGAVLPTSKPSTSSSAEATPAAPATKIVTVPAPAVVPQPHHQPKPRRHKVATPLSSLQLIHNLSVQDEMGLLTTVVAPNVNQALPTYGGQQFNVRTTPLGGLMFKNVAPGSEGLLQSAVQEVKNGALVPMDAIYTDDAIANPTSALQLTSLQNMFKEGVSLDQAKSVFAKHYTHLAQSGVESVYVSADLPASYNVRVRKFDHYKIVHVRRHGHRVRRREKVYKWETVARPIDPQAATQFVLAKVRAAQSAGLSVVAGAFPGESSATSTNPNPYALTQALGAAMEVSAATPTGANQSVATTASAYNTLRQLNAKTDIMTAPLTSPDGTAQSLASLAVRSLAAGSNEAVVQLPSNLNLADYLKVSGQTAEQAIAKNQLSRRLLDSRVLAHLAIENVAPKTAVTAIDPHAQTVRYHWVRSQR